MRESGSQAGSMAKLHASARQIAVYRNRNTNPTLVGKRFDPFYFESALSK
jgi:hypothetical protein